MNIWILNHYAGTPDMQATRSYDLARQLAMSGHEVTIFASSFSHYSHREERLSSGESWKIEIRDGVRFIWVRTSAYQKNDRHRFMNMIGYSWRSWWLGRRLPERPDVIIGTCVHPFAPLSAYLLSLHKRCRFCYEVTDLWPQTLVDMGALSDRHPATLILRSLEKYLFSRAERIVSLLPNVGEYLQSIGISQQKLVWIPNGVDPSLFASVTPYGSQKTGRFTVMYVGGFSRYHALDTVIDAAKILQCDGARDIRFVFVGDGAEKTRIVAYAQELRLGNVEFRGLVPKTELAKVLGEADALVYSFQKLQLLRYGVSPVKIFDYLCSGRPIIYAVEGSNNPVAEAGAGVSIPAENAEALARAVMDLAQTPLEVRSCMGKRGIEYVKQNHSMEVLAKRLEAAIISAAN